MQNLKLLQQWLIVRPNLRDFRLLQNSSFSFFCDFKRQRSCRNDNYSHHTVAWALEHYGWKHKHTQKSKKKVEFSGIMVIWRLKSFRNICDFNDGDRTNKNEKATMKKGFLWERWSVMMSDRGSERISNNFKTTFSHHLTREMMKKSEGARSYALKFLRQKLFTTWKNCKLTWKPFFPLDLD